MDGQMNKGVLEMCLLYQLREKKSYGYDLLKSMGGAFPDILESTLYAILRRLKASGYAETNEVPQSSGPARKYYRITPQGRAHLTESMDSWKTLIRSVEKSGISTDSE